MAGGGRSGGGRFGANLSAFLHLHRQSVEADNAARARRYAARTRKAMREAKPSGQLGDSRLADADDLARAGLLDPRGLFLGAHLGRLLFWGRDESVLCYLRTGGGKGVCYLQPTLAHVRDRTLIVTDVKNGELAWSTAEHREKRLGVPNIFINPYGLHGFPTTRLNPFHLLIEIAAKGQSFDGEAEQIANILLPPPAKAGENDWVRKGAIELACLRMEFMARFDPENCTLSDLWRFINGDGVHFAMSFSLMATCGDESVERRAATYDGMRNDAPKQWEAIRSELATVVAPYDPAKSLGRATSAHEFDLRRLKHEPHTLFFVLPTGKLDAAAPFVSLLLNLIIETLASETGPVRTSFLLDEFANFPKIPGLMRSLRLHRSLGLQYAFFVQGRHSLGGFWSRDEVKEIEDQVGCTIYRQVWETEIIKDLELWSGSRTIFAHGVSVNGGTVETGAANLGESKRPVLQAEDIVGLGPHQQILRIASMPRLLIADAVPYYEVEPWSSQIRDVRVLHRG